MLKIHAWPKNAHHAVVAIAFLVGIGGGRPAQAHAILVESSPKIDDMISGPNVSFDLRYNSRIDQKRSRIFLKNPGGTKTILPLEPATAVDRLKTHATGLSPGQYTLRWQVLATDGHITRGDVPFSVKSQLPSSPQPPAQ